MKLKLNLACSIERCLCILAGLLLKASVEYIFDTDVLPMEKLFTLNIYWAKTCPVNKNTTLRKTDILIYILLFRDNNFNGY